MVLSLAAALALPACARNAATGERQLSFVSRDQEVALGRQAAEQVKQAPAVQEYVSRLGLAARCAERAP